MNEIGNSHRIMSDYSKYKQNEQLQQFLSQKYAHIFAPKVRQELVRLIEEKFSQYLHLLEVDEEEGKFSLMFGKEGIFGFFQRVQELEELDINGLFSSDILHILLIVYAQQAVDSGDEGASKISKQEIHTLKNKLRLAYVRYLDAQKEREMLLDKTYEERKNADYFNYLEKNIRPVLYETLTKGEDELTMEKTVQETDKDIANKDESFESFLENHGEKVGAVNIGSEEKNRQANEFQKELQKKYIDPIVFFHTIQKVFRKYNYVLTFDDIARIKAIRKDITDGKLLFLSGDTGSGKTELAIMIAKIIIKEQETEQEINADFRHEKEKEVDKKDAGFLNETWKQKYGDSPIIVGGNRSTDMSDFTLEKIITSRNYISSQEDDIGDIGFDMSKKLLDQVLSSSELKEDVSKMIEQIDDPRKKKQAKEQLEQIDLTEYNIFTEHHLKGMFLAMRIGRPVIIDELNAIRPEILIGLNHYFTRKVGEKIQLPNGLGSFRIKEGFCIISTGNDKDTNVKKDMYLSRYTIDESLINRMNIYQKGYMKQVDTQFDNSRMMDDSEGSRDTVEYLQANEMYGVLLMLFFEGNEPDNTPLSTFAGKVGFELIKEEFVNKSNKEKRSDFFADIKKFSLFVAKSQSAFAGEAVTVDGKDISNKISKKVLSMRQVRNIVAAYKETTYPLFYHLYTEFISDQGGGGTSDEIEAFLMLAHDTKIMPSSLRTDKLDACKENVRKRISTVKQGVDHHADTSLVGGHDQQLAVNQQLLEEGSLVITKQDAYEAYFGKKLEHIDDAFFLGEDFESYLSQKKENTFEEEEDIEKEISREELLDQLDALKEILDTLEEYRSNRFFQKLSFVELSVLTSAVENLRENNGKILEDKDQETRRNMKQIFSNILNRVLEGEEFSDEDFENAMEMMRNFSG